MLGAVTLVASQPPNNAATADTNDNPLEYTSELYIPLIVDLVFASFGKKAEEEKRGGRTNEESQVTELNSL